MFGRLFQAVFANCKPPRGLFPAEDRFAMTYDAKASLDLCRTLVPSPASASAANRTSAWLLESKRSGLCHDRLDFIVEDLPQAACMLEVRPGSPGSSGNPSYDAKAHIWNHSQ